MKNEVRQLCEIVARLSDALEIVAKDVCTSQAGIDRIQNVRHDVLMLARSIER